MKVAVITPYYREDLETLRRCHESVIQQTYPCTHFFVSDGNPKQEVSMWDGQHIILSSSHGDYGNTPRGIGGISALNQGFDALAYLDADNWYASNHVESLVNCCEAKNCEVAFSSRYIVLSNGQICSALHEDEIERSHVDTSCFFITSRGALLISAWAMMDPKCSPVCDRVMFNAVTSMGFTHAWTDLKTVYYLSNWACDFEAAGLSPPSDCHSAIGAIYDPQENLNRLGYSPLGPVGIKWT